MVTKILQKNKQKININIHVGDKKVKRKRVARRKAGDKGGVSQYSVPIQPFHPVIIQGGNPDFTPVNNFSKFRPEPYPVPIELSEKRGQK